MSRLLEAGFGIEEFTTTGRIEMKTMWIAASTRDSTVSRLYLGLGPKSSSLASTKGIDVLDISEIRFGKISKALDSKEESSLLTIVGSESSFFLVIKNEALKLKLCRRMQAFITVKRLS